MIVQITGQLKYKDMNELIIEANGVGYLCHISNNTFNQLPHLEETFMILEKTSLFNSSINILVNLK